MNRTKESKISFRSATPARRRASTRGIETLEVRLLMSTYYVDGVGGDGLPGGGLDSNPGSITQPFLTIQKGVSTAVAGDTVYIRGGIYREQIYVPSGHAGSTGNYITYSAYNDEVPDIRGSDVVTGWTNYSGNIWMKGGWTNNSQQVFDDGLPLQQIGRPPAAYYNPNDGWDEYPSPVGTVPYGTDDLAPGRFWLDTTTSTLYVQLSDNSNPNNSLMEASVNRVAGRVGRTFMAEANLGYLKLQGLTFQHSNTSAFAEQGAMVNLSSNSIAENCTFKYADFAGVSMGWPTSKVQIINCTIANNGDTGIGIAATTDFVVRGNTVTGNNYRHFYTQWHAGGIKAASGAWGLYENNEINSNYGSGLWLDYCNSANTNTIRNNYIHDNGPDEAAIFYEAGTHGLIYNNVLVNNNRRGIYVSGSSDVQIYNNTIIAQRGISGIEVLARSGVPSTNTVVQNNIIANGTSGRDLYMSTGTGNSSNYNVFYRATGFILNYNGGTYTSLTNWRSATGFDMNSQGVNPQFIVGSGDDYRLASTSPAIDVGIIRPEVTVDYLGAARPQGLAYDVGAYEATPSAPPAPSVPDMDAGCDSGSSNSDNITNDTTPTFSGTAQADSIVKIFAEGTLVGQGTASAGGAYTITTSALASGTCSITATATNGIGTGPVSAGLGVTIDTVAPQVTGSPSFLYETTPGVAYPFTESISATLSVDDFIVQNLSTGTTVPYSSKALGYAGETNIATLSFPGYPNGALPDGNYRVILPAASALDLAGNPNMSNTFTFFALAGDANHDRVVDISDLGILATNWQQSGKTFSQGDFNYDGTVDISDLGILATSWQKQIAAPAAPLTRGILQPSKVRTATRLWNEIAIEQAT